MDVKIIVAAHKPYWMPDDPMYVPLHVGCAGRESFGLPGDDTGENISRKNANYCELTGLYWAWKNLPAEYLGLAHYRRHFAAHRGFGDKKARVLTTGQAARLLEGAEVILPKPRHYWIETNYSQYVHAHHAVDLEVTRGIIADRCPDYLPAWDAVMKRTWGHRFNMFIMRRDRVDAWCAWLFDVLFELERRLDISAYNPNDSRVFGFVGERLMDVWLEKNRIPYRELPCLYLERINWLAKGTAFLKRKLRGGAGS